MMRKIIVDRFGGPEALSLFTVDVPEPGANELLVSVAYAGVAFSDLLMRQGGYPGGPRPPFTPGWDVVGKVVAAGASVSPELIGRDVAGLAFLGGYADHVLVNAAHAVELPAGVDRRAAACLPLNYATALQMIVRVASASAEDTVLVRSAAGGVGTAALDIARALKVLSFGVSSPEKADAVRKYGAIWVATEEEERAAASIDGFDILLDPVGGAETWRGMRLLQPAGRLVSYGFSGMAGDGLHWRLAAHLAVMRLRSLVPGKSRANFFRLSASARRQPCAYRNDLKRLLALLAEGRLDPLVADVIPLSQAGEAHRRLADRAVRGKLLLDPQS